MNFKSILLKATDKSTFKVLNGYISFCSQYLSYIDDNLQAVIVSQNEVKYQFYQYNKSLNYQITRPINSDLMYDAEMFTQTSKEFLKILSTVKSIDKNDTVIREIINRTTYTIQQSIGAALDALPAGKSNTARKLNGDLFEHLIRLIIRNIGIECDSGVVQIPVIVDNEALFNMSYQHDLIIKKEENIKVLGSIKTSSKDRMDKIFIDKFLYNKLTKTQVPHIAIFLNDVQRKKAKTEGKFVINSTFLPGHFKGYTIKLNPLDGVYYCDIRNNMITEDILKEHIKTFDNLIIEDIWRLL